MKRRILLYSFRVYHNYKQSYLANKLNISLDAYQDIESGKTKHISEDKKAMIASILDMPIEQIDVVNLDAIVGKGHIEIPRPRIDRNNDFTVLRYVAQLKKSLELNNRLLHEIFNEGRVKKNKKVHTVVKKLLHPHTSHNNEAHGRVRQVLAK